MLLIVLLLGSASTAAAQDVKITTPFPRVEVNSGQSIQLTVTVANLVDAYETVSLEVVTPDGWEATLKSGSYLVKMVTLEPLDSQGITLTITQPDEVSVGSYTVEVRALDGLGGVKDSLDVIVDVAEVEPLGLRLSPTSPSIVGPAGEDFQFTMSVVNDTGEERDVDFSYVAPANWTVTFTQGYETTLVRAIHMAAGASQTMKVNVTPAADVDSGEYPISVVASSGVYSQTLELTTVITGTYEMSLTTSDGLLNLSAAQGESTPMTLLVQNVGSGILEQVNFRTSTLVGWEVTFEPTEIDLIEAGSSVQETVRIKPASDAIPGDYSLTLTAYSGGSNPVSEQIQLRVTVLGSAVWGLVGMLIIAVVVAGMVFIFWRLGRR